MLVKSPVKYLTSLQTNAIGQSPFLEAYSPTAAQEIPIPLRMIRLLFSLEPASCPYFMSDEFSSHPHILLL
jgi:hypothetical protein